MEDEDSDWLSGLQTVSSFDDGLDSSDSQDSSEELQQFSPSSLLVESLISQLCKLVEKDPIRQKQLYLKICKKLHQLNLIDKSYEMEEFESMRSYYQEALFQLITVAKNVNENIDKKKAVLPKPNQQVCRLKGTAMLEWSRYSMEYQELDFIAQGGFGQVYKARHKLDGEVYAMKKIFLRYNNATGFMQSLVEVKMLAKLNHPNIVAYKAAWLQPISRAERAKHIFNEVSTRLMESSTQLQESSGGIVFETSDVEESLSNAQKNLALIQKRHDDFDWNVLPMNSYCQEWACLYIQMQLCEATLRQWLDNRNQLFEPVKESQILTLFKKIVQGVDYIHSQGIVHHDIKPSNIFVSEGAGGEQLVQVGDFGLACSLLTHNPEVAVIPSTHAHRGKVGTKLYAAPEQLSGLCTSKSDIYSLGIVLLELMQPFHTGMERSKIIGGIKTGHIPVELTQSFPVLVKVMTRCLYHSPNKRPSAHELLELLDSEDTTNSARIIAEKDATIQRLHHEALEREQEIAELKRQLSELSMANSPEKFEPLGHFL